MNEEFRAWLAANSFDPEAVAANEQQRTALQTAWRASLNPAPRPTSPPPPPAPSPQSPAGTGSASENVAAMIEQARADTAVVGQIDSLIAKAVNDEPHKAELIGKIHAEAVQNGRPKMTIDQVKNALWQVRMCGPVPNPANSGIGADVSNRVIEAALSIQERLPNLEKRFDAQTLDAAKKHFPRGIGLAEVYYQQARANGYHGSPRDIKAMMEAAFSNDFARRDRGGYWASSGPSSIDAPTILSNTANKTLEMQFLEGEQAYNQVARIHSAKDFKEQTFVRLTGVGTFERIAPDGQIKDGKLSDMSYTVKAKGYGKRLGIGYEMLRNDDVGAFTGVAAELGLGANEIINNVFWDAFADALTTLFPTDDSNDNYLNSSSAFSLTALDAAESKFRLQTKPGTGPNGEVRLLGILPGIILVPAKLGNKAAAAMGTPNVVIGGGSSESITPAVNVFAGRYQVVSSAFMEVALNSSAKWFLIARPTTVALMLLSFLDGIQVPVVEASPFDFNTLGQQWRSHFAFGVGTGEYRGGVYNTGAS